MKKLIALLMVLTAALALWGCSKEPAPTTAVIPATTAPATEPRCVHEYTDADCTTPKTCALCGITRGNALGHDYAEGICSRCGAEDATYVALLDGSWCTEALNETSTQIENICMRFREDGTVMFAAGIYDRLSDVPEDQRESYMLDEENWLDYSGEIYYYAGFGVYNILSYTVEGNIITCTLEYDAENTGTLILERTSGNVLTVTYFEGPFSIHYLQVGDSLIDRT